MSVKPIDLLPDVCLGGEKYGLLVETVGVGVYGWQRGRHVERERHAGRFGAAAKRYGLSTDKIPLDTSKFRVAGPQLSLF